MLTRAAYTECRPYDSKHFDESYNLKASPRNASIIPQIGNKYFKAKCMCNNSIICGQISRSFQELKDLRGSFVQFPMFNGSKRFYIQNAMKIKRAERFSLCLQIPNPLEAKGKNGEAMLLTDSRNRGKNAKNDTSVDEKHVKRRRGFIALHHFHPKVINPKCGIATVQCDGTRFRLPDLVPISKLLSMDLMKYYTADDRYDPHNFLIVPNYSYIESEKDLNQIFARTVSLSPPLPLKSAAAVKPPPPPLDTVVAVIPPPLVRVQQQQ